MSKYTVVGRNPIMVFAPALVMALAGLSLISQPNAFGKQHELIQERVAVLSSQDNLVAGPSFQNFFYPRLLTNGAGQNLVVVNKLRPLNPIDYAPAGLRIVKSSKSLDNSRSLELEDSAATQLEKLAAAMFLADAGQLYMNSGYRSYDYQVALFKSKTVQYGLAGALIRSAKAGHSEHQTGLTMDVSVPAQGCAIMQCFGNTLGGKWLATNSWQFGFIIRYEEGTQAITGYTYEPWHLRFIGTQLAWLYQQSGLRTLEEFWEYPAAEFYEEEITASTID